MTNHDKAKDFGTDRKCTLVKEGRGRLGKHPQVTTALPGLLIRENALDLEYELRGLGS